MAVTYTCDRCGFKTEEVRVVHRYTMSLIPEGAGDDPFAARFPDNAADKDASNDAGLSTTVDLCHKCIDRAWRVISDQLFKADR